jgi:hypothetical protein
MQRPLRPDRAVAVRVTGSDDDRQTWAMNGVPIFSLSAKIVSLLPRDCKQFVPCRGHRLGFGDCGGACRPRSHNALSAAGSRR